MAQNKKPLHGNLNDTVIFSICGLSSIALCQAFDETYNNQFKTRTIERIFIHFNVNEQIRNCCLMLLNGDGQDQMDPYYTTLNNEQFENILATDIIRELLILFINQGTYSSRVRYFIRHVSYGLHVGIDGFYKLEAQLVAMLLTAGKGDTIDDPETIQRNKSRRNKRVAMISAAAIGGGVLIGITGGLAAPFIAAGLGTIGASIAGGVGSAVTVASAAIGTSTGIAVVGSLFGGAGAGLTGRKMLKRVGGLKEFSIEPLSTSKQLTLAIAVTGFVNNGTADFYLPWCTLDLSGEQYYIVWETQYLVEMGKSIDYLLSYVKSAALSETLKLTVLGALLTAVVWPSVLLTMSSVIDNPWSVCISRAELAGRTLAHSLLNGDYGRRPVSLIGFSLGARVVFYCLQELASLQSELALDIVEDVYLIGAPVTGSVDAWSRLERVVASRIVNGYCKSDWMLKFLFRTTIVCKTIAGLGPVSWENKRMCNMDISNVVTGHGDYVSKMPEILEFMGVSTRSFVMPVSPS